MPIIRANFNNYEDGEEYKNILEQEANRNLQILFALLSSYWQSTIDGPNYARELKSMSLAMAKLRISLDDIKSDNDYRNTRADYLYQTITTMLFPQTAGSPNPKLGDVDFREFLLQVINIYFAGSIPESMKRSVELFVKGNVVVKENFLETRAIESGYDISDEFGFSVDVILANPGDVDFFLADKNIRILLNIIRPAHTLYKLKYVLSDLYIGQQTDNGFQTNKVADAFNFSLSNYGYENFKKFVDGIDGLDYLGSNKSVSVVDEDHSDW